MSQNYISSTPDIGLKLWENETTILSFLCVSWLPFETSLPSMHLALSNFSAGSVEMFDSYKQVLLTSHVSLFYRCSVFYLCHLLFPFIASEIVFCNKSLGYLHSFLVIIGKCQKQSGEISAFHCTPLSPLVDNNFWQYFLNVNENRY